MSNTTGVLELNMKRNVPDEHPWNVIEEHQFKTLMLQIFNKIYNALSRTAGPYGSGTIIERLGEYHMTKDGYTALSHIHFDEPSANAVMDLIQTMSHQMVMKVGDGSTTTIMAAKNFMDIIDSSGLSKELRPKDFVSKTQGFIDKLIMEIEALKIPVTDDNYLDIVKKVSYIATNGDEEYTKHIIDIYEKCGKDVHIGKEFSETTESGIQIKDDTYHIRGSFLDKTYVNTDNNTAVIEHPIILLFDFTLEDKHWQMIQMFMQFLNTIDDQSRVVVIAPYYDNFIGDRIRADVIKFREFYKQKGQAGAPPYPLVFAKAPFIRPVDHYIYDDLTPYLGSTIINLVTAEEFMNAVNAYMNALRQQKSEEMRVERAKQEAMSKSLSPEEFDKIKAIELEKQPEEIYKEAMEMFMGFIGRCDNITLGMKEIEFSGFSNKDQAMLDVHLHDAQDMLNKEYAQVENSRYVHKEYMYALERIQHLSCKSATIKIGGKSELERSMQNDSVDDAIKACSSAVKHGYYYGNNLAIFKALKEIQPKLEDPFEKKIGNALWETFCRVILTIHKNKNPDTTIDYVKSVINKSLEDEMCFDLTTEEYNRDVINSIKTDIEIIKGSISLVGTLMSANQYIASQVKRVAAKNANK